LIVVGIVLSCVAVVIRKASGGRACSLLVLRSACEQRRLHFEATHAPAGVESLSILLIGRICYMYQLLVF